METLLTFAILGVMLALTFPLALTAYRQTEFWETRDLVIQTFRRARSLTLGAADDEPWGVKFEPGTITVFKGGGFGGRDPAVDEVFLVPAAVTWSGTDEIIFGQVSGIPLTAGPWETTMTFGDTGTVLFRVNEQGLPSYE